jgi:2-polyprenyl-3-methyl-5-hydroxy-6-metoxy-1,4-benzoquinol methylase
MCAFKRTILPGTKYLLDAGCGTGELSLLMAEMRYRVTGLDLSPYPRHPEAAHELLRKNQAA